MWKNPISDTKEERVMERMSSDSHLFFSHHLFLLSEEEGVERERNRCINVPESF